MADNIGIIRKITGRRPEDRPAAEEPVRSVSLSYDMTYGEVYEALLMIIDKRSKKARYGVGIFLLAAAAACAVLFAMNPYGLMFEIGAVLFALFSFLVLCYPGIKAKQGAKKISRRKGTYKVTLFSDGYIVPHGGERLDIRGDKDCRAFESDAVFALRLDRMTNFCLPKRRMNGSEIQLTRKTLQTYARRFFDRRSGK
jgi:hypothetical protein